MKLAVMTLGTTWAQLFENSLARKMAGIEHINLGFSDYKLPPELLDPSLGDKQLLTDLLERLNSKSLQASEVVYRFQWYVRLSTVIFLDAKVLDTALGQFILSEAKSIGAGKPVYAVATDYRSSPIAAAFLKATLYPETPDDLVKICLQHKDPDKGTDV